MFGRDLVPTAGVAVAIMVLLHACLAARIAAQSSTAAPTLAVSASIGRHALGAGFEVALSRRLALAARAEGWLPARYAAAGAGVRVNAISSEQAHLYGVGLVGGTQCKPPALDGSSRCIDRKYHAAVAALGGAEIILGNGSAWSAGVEAGYWFALSRESASADVDHFTFAAMLRWRH